MQEFPQILNWRRVDARVTLSGQPTVEQFESLAGSGIRHIINLAPADNDTALPNEAEIIAGLGMEYVYIPVDFDAPTDEDYRAFLKAFDLTNADPVHIHCIYNARVTAFMYCRTCELDPASKDTSFDMMDGIWRPGGVWAEFIGNPQDAALPNRYAGYEY